jgi:Protein of unknown function (DUF3810)
MVRAVVVAVAVAAALVPLPAAVIERYYSAGFYPVWQSWMTPASNAVPVALLDVLIVGVAGAWLILAVHDLRRWRARGVGRTAGRVLARTAVWAAVVYLVFLASWGLNYRRVPLAAKLEFDAARVSESALRTLASTSVARLNELHPAAHRQGWPDALAVDPAVASGFAAAQRGLGATRVAVPARPKHTLLNLYFRRAVVDGMTDPMFLETLVVSDLLPFERPIVTAHEWAHLAGYNDEGEANFVGWLSCMRGDEPRQYSAWIFLYSEAVSQLPRGDRQQLAQGLDSGPREDLRAIADRVARNRSARVAQVGWQVYNQYLQANRVESGTASYGEVIRLILGTRFNPATPTRSP